MKLVVVSFPGFNLGFLVWVGLFPLLNAINRENPRPHFFYSQPNSGRGSGNCNKVFSLPFHSQYQLGRCFLDNFSSPGPRV
jgi:hypothetical protein